MSTPIRTGLGWTLTAGKVVIWVTFAILLSPLALVLGIWMRIRGGADVGPHELSGILRAAADDQHPAWDELECVRLRDPRLEAVRQEALNVDEPSAPGARAKLIDLAQQAEDLSA